MTSGTSEALKDAARRALPLVLVLMAVGAVTMVAFRQYQGSRYEASAHVFISTVPIGPALAGTQTPYVDPRRTIDNAVVLARSLGLYTAVADDTGGELGSASELREATSVGGSESNDVIGFTATADDPERASAIANAVSSAYPEYRADIALRDIDRALEQLRIQIAGSPDDAVLREKRDQLELLQTLLNSGDATVIERAEDATKVNPRPLRDALVGAALGLVIALLIAGTREALNTRVRNEADVEDLLDRPVLASIQSLPRRTRLVTLDGRYEARFSDTFALLAANIVHMREGDAPSTLAVTSALKGEGKTSTAANLSVAFARRGLRVVLVDLDLRKPAVASVFGMPAGVPGVLQLLDGNATLQDALWEVSLNGAAPARRFRRSNGRGAEEPAHDGGGSLHVLPAGGSVRLSSLSHSPRVADILAGLKRKADIVVIDTPPALVTAEMAELSTLVDMILLVARQGRVTRRGLRTLGKQAQAWQAEVVGAVVTGTPTEDRYSYYGS